MNIIDRISLHRLITTIMNFILAVLKVVVHRSTKDTPTPRRRFPLFRKEK